MRPVSLLSAVTSALLAAILVAGGSAAPVNATSESTTTTSTSTTTTTTLPDTTTSTSTTTTTEPPAATTTTTAAGTTTTTTEAATTTTSTSSSTTTTTTPVTATTVCLPPTTTTTTTTTTLPPGATTTTSTTTTTTLPPGATTTTTTTTVPPPPCPTTTTSSTTTTTVPPTDEHDAAPLGIDPPKNLADILLTIRTLESGGRYEVPPNKGNASGAYQYIASTWNNHAGYPHAYLAPPHVQDARALADVEAILWTWKGDVSMVPVIWYYPRAAKDPVLMDQVPIPSAGNVLTVREYQRRWLELLAFISGDPSGFRLALAPPGLEFLSGIPPVLDAGLDTTQIAFPVLGSAAVAPPRECDAAECEPGSVAIVYGQKLQPVLAAVSGIVTAVDEGHPVTGGVTLTITDAEGRTYEYAGFNDDNPGTDDSAAPRNLRFTALGQIGSEVRAGQIIGFMGDTDPMPSTEHLGAPDDAVWPHIRLTIRDADGNRLDADLLTLAAQRNQACHVGIGPWSVPAKRSDRDGDDIEVDAILNGGWTIAGDGGVTAFGPSALILAPGGCEWSPPDAFGPGGSGNQPPPEWYDPVDVPVRHLVPPARATPPVAPLRRG